MARSLMELYGGGMVYPANNYQLGGVIAGARRGREYQGEVRRLEEEAEKAAAAQQKASGWGKALGTIGGIAGSVIPGVGTALGAGIGSGLGTLLGESTYKPTEITGGKYAKESRGHIKEAQKEYKSGMGERALVSGLQSAMMGKAYGEMGRGIQDWGARTFGIGGEGFAERVTEQGLADNPWLATESAEGYDFFSDPSYFGAQSGGLIDYMMPRRMQEGGYATATDPLQALEQMGFEDVAADPQLQDYLEDLPQFQQGYTQQIGDITATGQQQLGQLGTQRRQQQAKAGFAGGGVGAGAAQQARAGIGREFQRGRRGIVESFQADLLGAIGDIEAKGEFEFGGPRGPETAISAGEQQYQAQEQWYQLGFPDETSWQNWVNAGGDYNQLGTYGGSSQAAQQNISATTGLSDIRLKKDVHHLFTMKNNVPIYTFKYKWSDDINIGTMAQAIEGFMPEAVGEISGYKTVNYDIVFNSQPKYRP